MKRLILTTALLLTTVISEDFLAKDHEMTLRREQFWSVKKRRIPRDLDPVEFDDFPSYQDESRKESRRNSWFLADSLRLPDSTLLRCMKIQCRLWRGKDHSSFVQPTKVLTRRVGLREIIHAMSRRSTTNCNSNKRHRYFCDWQLQIPLYVEEPRWVEIEADYSDRPIYPTSETNILDPFFVTRGKKIPTVENKFIDKSCDDYDQEGPMERDKRSKSLKQPEKTTNASFVSFREKRRSCKDSHCENELEKKLLVKKNDYNQLVRNIQKSIFDSIYVERRDKYSDILDILKEPFIISKGKKDGTTAKKKSFRDRRGPFDNILKNYDPYLGARGKRPNSADPGRIRKNSRISKEFLKEKLKLESEILKNQWDYLFRRLEAKQ